MNTVMITVGKGIWAQGVRDGDGHGEPLDDKKISLHTLRCDGKASGEILFKLANGGQVKYYELVDDRYVGCVNQCGYPLGRRFKVTETRKGKVVESEDSEGQIQIRINRLRARGKVPYVEPRISDDKFRVRLFDRTFPLTDLVPESQDRGSFKLVGLEVTFVKSAFRTGHQIELHSKDCLFKTSHDGKTNRVARLVTFGSKADRPGCRVYLGKFRPKARPANGSDRKDDKRKTKRHEKRRERQLVAVT